MTDLADLPAPRFETKVALLVSDDLEVWQRLNVTAFLASGLTAAAPQLVGEPYADADGQTYLPLLGQPVLVFTADLALLRTVHQRAVRREIGLAIFTADMFRTGHDAANRAVVRDVPGAELDLVGLGLHSTRNVVDRVVKGAALHP